MWAFPPAANRPWAHGVTRASQRGFHPSWTCAPSNNNINDDSTTTTTTVDYTNHAAEPATATTRRALTIKDSDETETETPLEGAREGAVPFPAEG